MRAELQDGNHMRGLAGAAFAAVLVFSGTALAQNTNGVGSYGSANLTGGFSPDPYVVQVHAGGTIEATTITEEGLCRGYIANNPDYTLDYTAGDDGLYISALAESDTTLVVYAPDGYYYCDDDSGGEGETDPGVYLPKPASGRYQIWVGTYSSNSGNPLTEIYISGVDYIHALRSVAVDAGLAGYGANPSYGAITLAGNFPNDPRTASVVAGGAIHLTPVMEGCSGYVSPNMDYRVTYTGQGALPLIFSVDSTTDTTMVVRSPDGPVYCDDDSGENGSNPAVRIDNPRPGQYDVWVGVYTQSNTGARATLYISELTSR